MSCLDEDGPRLGREGLIAVWHLAGVNRPDHAVDLPRELGDFDRR